GRDGTVLRSDNDYVPITSNAVIEAGLQPGTYTVEATTNARGERGNFELLIFYSPLNVSGACETALGTLSAGRTITRSSETWVDTCDSANRPNRYARYYTFTLSQTVAVTIDLTAPDSDGDGSPDTDTILYLLPDDWTGDFITANNNKDDDTTNSRIRIGLTPGTYTVEATTRAPAITGDFALAITAATAPLPVASHGATTWHRAGIKGQGVKVGVIDVGFDGFGALMGTELPATVHMRCYTDIGEFTQNIVDCEVDSAHGTAVAETIIDIAPDVDLYIANPVSRADLRAATEWMLAQGVQVINYSVGWVWDGPGDGTSPNSNSPNRTVDAAVAGGILWVNAAGNDAENTYFESSYHDEERANGLIEFRTTEGIRVPYNAIALFWGYPLIAQLRWDDSWGGASSDLDLYLYDAFGALVASSTDFQTGGPEHIPYEVLYYVPPDSGVYFLEVSNGDVANLGWLQVQDFFGVSSMAPVTLYGSIGNPAESANPGLLAAGAAPWAFNSEIELFSSRGPTPDGRTKPDLVGADRADTVAYGPAGFPGTSQGAPHVAGLAALVLQHYPALTPAEVARYLQDRAQQRAEPSPDNRDPNNIWGHGYARLPAVPRTPAGPMVTGATPGDEAITISWEEPSYTGSSTITAYDVRYRETGTTDWAQQDNAWRTRGGALEYTISGLTANTEYDVQVRAVNGNGDGAWSRIASHSTLTATATGTNPLRATATDTVVLSTTAPATMQIGPDDVLVFAPTTATEAGLVVRKTTEAKLEITTDATTTVSKTTATTTLEFGPDDPLTITLPRQGEAATLTFLTVDGTNVERVVTHSLKQIPLPPPPSSGDSSSSRRTSRSSARTPAPTPTPEPLFSASNSTATVNERKDGPGQSSLVFQRHDRPEASFDLPIGWISRDGTQQIPLGFVRDETLGQTYAILRRESDGQIVRWWIAGNSPWVYSIPWAEVNSRYTVPLAVLALIPLDDQYPQPNQLVRRFDGGDGRIVAYDAGLGQWRHIPDLATFQALNFYWCDVTAADGAFFERITLGPPYPASSTPARSDYPSCRT
ncbi:MAG: S8 family serine peptidase, partial [Chloroflexota bacterium]|nr:S8 family serine peptidase [Chloroflexota bacterium]